MKIERALVYNKIVSDALDIQRRLIDLRKSVEGRVSGNDNLDSALVSYSRYVSDLAHDYSNTSENIDWEEWE